MTHIITLWVAILVSSPPSAFGSSGLEQTTVFIRGELGYKKLRIPVLVVCNSGTFLAISEVGRTNSDFGDRDLLLRRSVNGGRTWSSVEILHDEGTRTCGNPTVIVNRIEGRIHMLSTVDALQAFYNYSDDDGLAWSHFRDITGVCEQFKPRFPWTRFATGSGLGIELKHGEYKGRFVMTIWFTSDEKVFRSAVIYSDDRGTTWKPGGLTDPDFMTNECTIYEGVDGILHLNMRGGDNHPNNTTSCQANGYF